MRPSPPIAAAAGPSRRLARAAVLLATLVLGAAAPLGGCAGGYDPVGPPPDPFPTITPPEEETPGPPLIVVPARRPGPVLGPDGGLSVRIGADPLADLAARQGGALFPPVAALEVAGSLRAWLAPSGSADPAAAATGTLAARVEEALDARRYVALRFVAEDEDDLPVGLPVAEGEPALLPDGVVALFGAPGDDDDDSDGDDDSASGGGSAPRRVRWADPDLFPLVGGVATALADRFAAPPLGLAYVVVSGVGLDGAFALPDDAIAAAGFTESSWVATIALYTELFRARFPGVPLFLSLDAVRVASDSRDALLSVLAGDEVALRDDCFGACDPGVDYARFPGEGGASYPASDPHAGWLPAAVAAEGFPLAYGGAAGGFGAWRQAAAAGTWDGARWGDPFAHLDAMWGIRARHAPGRFLALADDPCAGRWAVAAAPAGEPCGAQPAAVHPAIQALAAAVEPRLAVARVVLPANWHALDAIPLTVDLVNEGGVASGADRGLDVALVGPDGATLASGSALPDAAGAGALGPGAARAVALTAARLAEPPPGASVRLLARVPEPRAFGGALPLAHADAGDGWALLATIVVPAE